MMLLYVDQSQNHDPRIQQILRDHGLGDVDKLHKSWFAFDPGTKSLYNRQGKNTLPFKNGFRDMPGFRMPDYDATFNKSWKQVTDERCHWLKKHKFDKRWIIGWSGGIDSTGILASIIQNIPPADFENITVACNKFSVWENPKFFFDFIQPNFQVIESKNLIDLKPLKDGNYTINGEPADQLFSGGVSQTMMMANGISYLHKDAVNDAGSLIEYIAKSPRMPGSTPPGFEFAEWYYSSLIENIKSTTVPIQTFHDLLWWGNFNLTWTSIKLRTLTLGSLATLENAKFYFDHCIHWFESDDYQRWAMKNNFFGEKYGSTVGEYKKQAKEYICNLDKNTDYLKYKTKTHAGDYTWMRRKKKWYCITDDLSLLNLEDHWEIIQGLLPGHICSA